MDNIVATSLPHLFVLLWSLFRYNQTKFIYKSWFVVCIFLYPVINANSHLDISLYLIPKDERLFALCPKPKWNETQKSSFAFFP